MKLIPAILSGLFALTFMSQVFATPINTTSVQAAALASENQVHHTHSKKTKAENTQVVNINTADANELATLKGIGIKKAEAIIAYRSQHGNFKTVEDLKSVKGISEKTIQKNHERLAVS